MKYVLTSENFFKKLFKKDILDDTKRMSELLEFANAIKTIKKNCIDILGSDAKYWITQELLTVTIENRDTNEKYNIEIIDKIDDKFIIKFYKQGEEDNAVEYSIYMDIIIPSLHSLFIHHKIK